MAARKLSGVVGFFTDPDKLVQATEKVRAANYADFDTFTPYPVHGLEHAQGLKRSWIPFVTFGAGLCGFSLAFLLEYGTSAVSWPLIVGGKPFNSWPAFVPIMFELTVLLAGLSTVAAMFIVNRLPNVTKKAIDPSLTRDRFAIFIGAPVVNPPDPVTADDEDMKKYQARKSALARFKAFDESEAQSFLKQVGAQEVRSVYEEGWF
jgi:hypothetical protein